MWDVKEKSNITNKKRSFPTTFPGPRQENLDKAAVFNLLKVNCKGEIVRGATTDHYGIGSKAEKRNNTTI